MAELNRIVLEKSSDISKVEQLHERFEALLESSAGVEIDAAAVERIDTSTLQLLVSFFNALSKHHLEARIVQPSASFLDTARLMGLSHHLHLND